ncbi:Zinc finger/thioredoxin putative domain-containing protein OS=Rhodanobacter lindaniclasticus OX=75310 GN=B1991_05830 PE=4 SV=1 [Rhodanobacter lindaniclasticus]
MRRLQPSRYLDDPATLRHGLDPGAVTVLLLEVKDPGDKAVAFEFGFE